MQYWITASRFNKIAKIALPVSITGAIIFFAVGIFYALVNSPPDYQQGESVRIMYVHVPSAWMSMSVYLAIAVSSASYLIWKNPLSGIFLKKLIPIGATFCGLCLITGAIWGKPIWGTYWVWDARLTSVLILFFIYIGLHILFNAYDDEEKALRATAVFGIIGVVNLPIIRFSVKWWNTLHQPASIMRLEKPALAPEILTPLILMFAFFMMFFIALFIASAKTEILKRKAKRASLTQ